MKKILFCLMILIIGICLISASYAISQENNKIGSTLPQSESHTIQHNPQNMQANSMTNSSNYTENKMQHYKDLTKTNNNTYKEVTINGSKYISTPEGLCPIKKTHNGTEYFTTKEGKTYYIVELETGQLYVADNTTSTNGYSTSNFTSNTEDNNSASQQNINKTTYTNNSIPLESTGIPIAILLIAIVGSIIGLKRKK